jgi:ubiquinone biosynthesis protein
LRRFTPAGKFEILTLIATYFGLVRAVFVLAREGGLAVTEVAELAPGQRRLVGLARLIERRAVRKTGRVERLAGALERLGPTYVKMGQLMAARPDIVGVAIAGDLGKLQDRMAPFDHTLVPDILKKAFGDGAGRLEDISPPVAAASIAQVHRAKLTGKDGKTRDVAVKILRPGIHERFGKDLKTVMALARLAERFNPASRRLRPVEVADTLARSAKIELDLRLEAAAIAEMAENCRDRPGFVVPEPIWSHVARNVLTTSWVEGIAIQDFGALDAAGVDRPALAVNLIRQFLHQAIEDGFFHADLHPGNLFVDPADGKILAVDFGIMGRIGATERRFLAEILYGFITGDYLRMAGLHIEIGYVPAHHDVADFAQALRAIGEPLKGLPAGQISMAQVLGQLMAVTEMFDMEARTELILLQKSMVLVEGLARRIDPEFNMWNAAEPIAGAWVRRAVGPVGRLEKLGETFTTLSATAGRIPGLIERFEKLVDSAEQQAGARPIFAHPLVAGLALGVVVLIGLVALRFLF